VTPELRKYPRTHHLEGSRLQPGDEDLEGVPFSRLAGRPLVVEEKIDGANSAVRFTADGRLLLQSRGHYLVGGARERHFDLLKTWATTHAGTLYGALGSRYVMYGEWTYAKHTIFYDRLPHYFLEFDVWDGETGEFLSTPRRAALLAGVAVASVPVLFSGAARSLSSLTRLIGPSRFIGPDHREHLGAACRERGLDERRAVDETDASGIMEGLYLKVEEGGAVTERYKYVRASFLTAVLDSGSHWLARPIVPNRLADGATLW